MDQHEQRRPLAERFREVFPARLGDIPEAERDRTLDRLDQLRLAMCKPDVNRPLPNVSVYYEEIVAGLLAVAKQEDMAQAVLDGADRVRSETEAIYGMQNAQAQVIEGLDQARSGLAGA